jgi:hypothetical protein
MEVLGAAEGGSRAGKYLAGTRWHHSLPRVAVAPESTGVHTGIIHFGLRLRSGWPGRKTLTRRLLRLARR